MAYQLDIADPLNEALRRTGAERIEHALAQLDDRVADDAESAVHEARKDVKKTRALLRLARPALGASAFRRDNRQLRDAGRELSAVRDAHVIATTVDALAERYAGQVPRDELEALAGDAGQEPVRSPEEAAAAARERIAPVLARLDEWEAADVRRSTLRKSLTRTYARGRDAFERARRDPSDERLHDLRKRVKDLRYQQQLLRAAWPGVLKAQAKAAKALSDLLGDDHDLAELQQRTDAGPELAELIAGRRGELQDEAFRLAGRVYAESPKRYAKRMDRYLRAGIRDGRAERTAA